MKGIAIALLVLLGLAGLIATACGGFFTIAALPDVWSRMRASGGYSGSILEIAVPCLIVGLVVVVLCFRGVRRMLAAPSAVQPADHKPEA